MIVKICYNYIFLILLINCLIRNLNSSVYDEFLFFIVRENLAKQKILLVINLWILLIRLDNHNFFFNNFF